MKTNMQSTSIAAYRALPVKQLATQADRIFDIVQFRTRQFAIDVLCGVPRKDMSLKEIQSRYEADYFTDMELSTISARVNALVAAGRLERLETTRKCSISNVSIHPVRVVTQ